MSAFRGRIQPIDATPFPSNLARWNGMRMEGHTRTWFMLKQKTELRLLGGERRPSDRGRRAVSKILALNGGIARAPRRRAPAGSVAVTG
jgi:hypothetical protein